jgi:hypothetical protein
MARIRSALRTGLIRFCHSGCVWAWVWVWVRGPTARRGDAGVGVPEINMRVRGGGGRLLSFMILGGGGRDRRSDEARD